MQKNTHVVESYLIRIHSPLPFQRYKMFQGNSFALLVFSLFGCYLWGGVILQVVEKQQIDVYDVVCAILALCVLALARFLYVKSGRWTMVRKVWSTAWSCHKSRKEFRALFGRDPSTMQPWLVHMHLICKGTEAYEQEDPSIDDITYRPKGHFRLAYESASCFFTLRSYETILDWIGRNQKGEDIFREL
jgi:hypothetical protein